MPVSGGKVRPPFDKEGVNAEWLTAALHERGHLPKAVKIAHLDHRLGRFAGQGRSGLGWFRNLGSCSHFRRDCNGNLAVGARPAAAPA